MIYGRAMAAPKNTRSTQEHANGSFGLLANGASGPWEIAIDEATAGPDRWFAQIEGPSIYFSFEIPSVDVVSQTIGFLGSSPTVTTNTNDAGGKPNGSLVISKDKKTPVTLVRDDEYPGRFFLVVGPVASPVVRFVLGDVDAMRMGEALRQVEGDLEDKD
jgi:hypothetical protein